MGLLLSTRLKAFSKSMNEICVAKLIFLDNLVQNKKLPLVDLSFRKPCCSSPMIASVIFFSVLLIIKVYILQNALNLLIPIQFSQLLRPPFATCQVTGFIATLRCSIVTCLYLRSITFIWSVPVAFLLFDVLTVLEVSSTGYQPVAW